MTEEEFYVDFTQDIVARSGTEENFKRSIYIEYMCSFLENEGYINGYDITEHKISIGRNSQAVDAWSFDDERSCLTLILADYRVSDTIESLTKTHIANEFKRLRNFFKAAINPSFSKTIEESNPVTELAWLIGKSKNETEKIHLILVSNAKISSQVEDLPNENACGYPTTYDVVDFERLYRIESSGKAREEMVLEFDQLEGGGLPSLPAYTGTEALKSYILIMSGKTLADLYDTHKDRLLEQNVRTFLQFRGKINKGIRNTIINEPHMFFSYNNGLSATAEAVETNHNGSRVLRIKNFQIVNGGQTTASIFTAHKKDKAALDKIYVQIKLSVIDPELIEEVVPKISEYSNTQNKVNAADFFSNHPFHLRMEEFSRRLWAPSQEGSLKQTHWFYERARGQFANQQARLTTQEKRKFLVQNPRRQMITKTDLAKFLLSFEEAPHEVSLGAQKAFSGTPRTTGLVGRVASKWDKNNGLDFNETWFKEAISKAIFFKEVDRLVYKSEWYSGYKANIVTYTLSKFANMVRKSGLEIDYCTVWEKQCLPYQIVNQFKIIAKKVNEILCFPPVGMTSNTSEWAKKEFCWSEVKKIDIELNDDVRPLLITKEAQIEKERSGKSNQAIEDTIHNQTYVIQKGTDYWKQFREWNRANKKLSPKELSILNIACSVPRKIPSEKQALILINAENRAQEEGFFYSGKKN
ncbi:AIPR family protein [Desulfoluna butyratoxydans]|uniref:Abortive bacteriophage infection resistance n=1 Tax=Desulfoluna butyratoxydans TaxID=231438 RepID=A0A4U8YMW1_9BACT|nr:AIPR family protein [Desulfoluna butyratoxydans]VFQ42972.1 abortive bacteriophage infection resistance [Desulfoluna butyratoxydans]